MSAAKPLPSRYVVLKAMAALDAAMADLSAKTAAGTRLSLGESAGYALSKFKEAYGKPLTTVMYMAGAAMAPSINKQAEKDVSEIEKLVGCVVGALLAFVCLLSSACFRLLAGGSADVVAC
jgi:hypothetical protein